MFQALVRQTVKQLRDRLENNMQWNASLRYVSNFDDQCYYFSKLVFNSFTSEENAAVTAEVTKAVANENYSVALVRSKLCL